MGKIPQAESAHEKMVNALKQFAEDGIKPLGWELSRQAHVDIISAALWYGVPDNVMETAYTKGIVTLYGYYVIIVDTLGAGMGELVGADGSRVSFQIDHVPPPPPPASEPPGYTEFTR